MQYLKRLIIKLLRIIRPLIPQWLVNYIWHLPVAFFASQMYGNPGQNLEIIGVTGTDGKTTTTMLIYHILKTARKKVAVISTIEARIGRQKIETGFHVTNPDPFPLQKLLRTIKSRKFRFVVLEATSHGLDQFRLFPLKPSIAVLTNITHEHLDYHKTMSAYQRAKLRLFKQAEHAVMNKDLPYFSKLNQALPGVHFSTYSIDSDSQLKAESVKYLRESTKFKLGNLEYELPLTGKYNLYNALAAIGTALITGVAPSDIRRALASFPGVPGRLEKIENNRGLHIYVDFAHTPHALQEVLLNLRSKLSRGEKLIVVFGAAGLRDASKRPLMGKYAGELADYVVITAEDPRDEDPAQIAKDILSGVLAKDRPKCQIVVDRSEAINLAINKLGKRGDWIVVCGKGHEKSMNLDGWVETPWSDQEQVRLALGVRL